ncbi:putative reverse transcriptase domain-containing protein [Tanacetum coccineum]
MGDENPIRTLGDYSKPSHEGYRNIIELPVGNNVVPLRSDTIRLEQNGCSFHGLQSEDPNQHLKDFFKLMDSLDLDGENRERTCLRLFQFSLRGKASNWLERLPTGSITTCEDLTTRFLTQFFLSGRTAKLHNDSLMFQQHHGESLSKAWTRFKDLLQKVPHHGIDLWLKLEKALLDLDSNQEKRLSHLRTQLGQQQDHVIGKINLLWKTVSEKLNDVSTPENAGNSMAHKSIAAISHDEREELRNNGIKSPSKLFSPKYLSPASIKELNKNLSAPKRVYFVNLIVILSTDSDTKEEDISSTNAHGHKLGNMFIFDEKEAWKFLGSFIGQFLDDDLTSYRITLGMDHHGVPDPMELDEHISVYVPKPEHPEYHVPTDDGIQVEDQPYADDASPIAESPRHIADSESLEEDSINYPDEPEDDDEDSEEDPEEDHTDYPTDGEDGDDEPSDDDDDDADTNDEDKEPTEDEEEEKHLALVDSSAVPIVDPVPLAGDTEAFETDESAPTPRSPQTMVPFSQTRLRRVRKTVRLEPPMSASMEARIVEHAAAPIPPTSPAYDQAPLGHRSSMIRKRDDIPEEDMPPRGRFILTSPPPRCDVVESSAAAARPPGGQYDFVDTVEAGQGLIRSPGHDARNNSRAADRAEDVGYVRALHVSEHRMMTSIEEVNLRVSYQVQVRRRESEDFYTQLHEAQTDRKDIRLEIDVVRGQRTAYETGLREVRQAYLSFEARNRALLARLETLETHMSRMEWQRQRAEDHAVRQMMRTQVLECHNPKFSEF